MKLEQLQYLMKVVSTQSFTAAGEQLFISQPTVSQSIAMLEKELGVKLLNRTRQGVTPTLIGMSVVEHARRICEEVNAISALCANTDATSRSLTIISTPTINTVILSRGIIEHQRSSAAAPVSKFNILQTVSSVAERIVANGEADFAVVPIPPDSPLFTNPNFAFHKLLSADIMAIMRHDNPLATQGPITFETIQAHPIALFSNQYITYNSLYSRISAFGVPNIVFESGNPELTQEMTRTYRDLIGFAYDINVLRNNSPIFSSGSEIVMVPIQDPVKVTIGVLSSKAHGLSPLSQEFIQYLDVCCASLQEELDAWHQR